MKPYIINLLSIFALIVSTDAKSQPNYYAGDVQVGEVIRPLHVARWLNGKPVAEFQKDRLYVVEFTGSWCPPCRKVFPHLNKLAGLYSGKIEFISVFLENNNTKDTTDMTYVDDVRYLISGTPKINVTIGVDVPQQETKKIWGLNGVPVAYVVVGNRIAWIGHPIDLSPVLEMVAKGMFDPTRGIAEQKEFESCIASINTLTENFHYDLALRKIDSLINVFPYRNYLHYQKFDMLARKNPREAYEWLQQILDNKELSEAFDWLHFIGGSFNKIDKNNRDYKLELKTIDRAINLSETQYHAAFPWEIKAKTYCDIADFEKASLAIQNAIDCISQPPGRREYAKRYYQLKTYYVYKKMATVNIDDANAWLRVQEPITVSDVIALMMDAVVQNEQPNPELALSLADKALNEGELSEFSRLSLIRRKIQLYVDMKDYNRAIVCCEQALTLSKQIGSAYEISRFENKLAKLKDYKN